MGSVLQAIDFFLIYKIYYLLFCNTAIRVDEKAIPEEPHHLTSHRRDSEQSHSGWMIRA